MTTATDELTHRVAARLGAPVTLETLPGGHSGLTYTTTVDGRRHVVKAVPPGQRAVGRNDVLRQASVLRRLAGSAVPVPAVLATDEREPAWFAMEFVAGEAVEPVLDRPSVPGALARARMLNLASVLGRLHRLPVAGEATSVAGEVARWSRTMRAVPAPLRPGGEELLARLAARVPAEIAPALAHGDFRLGNALCVGAEVRAVVDWEIWSVADPRVDLGYFQLFADHANFPALGNPVPGLPNADEITAAYGRELPDLAWFGALCRMKLAAIMGHNLRRHREGKHHDPDQERLPPTIAALISTALDRLSQSRH